MQVQKHFLQRHTEVKQVSLFSKMKTKLSKTDLAQWHGQWHIDSVLPLFLLKKKKHASTIIIDVNVLGVLQTK